MISLEEALIDLKQKAVDGNGLKVKLESWSGIPSAAQARVACREFMRIGIEEKVVWLSSGLPLSKESEAAYWDNLSLLARVASATIREEA